MKLETLKASSVRGIPRDWTALPFGPRGVVIYGPNGVGKSSVVDALERAIAVQTSLFPASRQGVNWETGGPHIHHGSPEIAAEISSGSESLSVGPDLDPEKLPEPAQRWVKAGRSASFVLRRHMLLNFITAPPKDRYGQLEPFLNLGAYQGIENELRRLADHYETQYTQANARCKHLEKSIQVTFRLDENVSISRNDLFESLNVALSSLGISPASDLESLPRLRDHIAEELGGEEQSQRLAALGSLKSQLPRLRTAAELTDLLDGLIAATVDYENQVATRTEAVLTDLLLKGREAIQSGELEACPICEQSIDRDAVTQRLNERIAADERISAAERLVTQRRLALLTGAKACKESTRHFLDEWNNARLGDLPEAYPESLCLFNDLVQSLESRTGTLESLRDYRSRITYAPADHEELTARLDRQITDEGGGSRRDQLTYAHSMTECLLSEFPRYQEQLTYRARMYQRKDVITTSHGHATDARKEAVQETLKDVVARTNEFYDRMHPGEGIATSSLDVRGVGHGSINLQSTFYGKQAHPLLFYSESHLDTLGLCYFLALRRHEAVRMPEFKVLVLDDVMHSVDADHRTRIARLLKDEFSDHQVVITTHDLNFFEILRRTLGSNGFTYYRISNWDLSDGPLLGDPLTDLDRITVPAEREKLGAETLSSAGGRFFEWLLREISESLTVAIPARFKQSHDVGSMWPAVAARLRKQKGFSILHEPTISGLDDNAWVRNRCGAHHNEDEVGPSDAEVREFAELLTALYESLHCGECGDFASKRSDDRWACECERIVYKSKAGA